MSNESACLTYPDLVCCLDGTSGTRAPGYAAHMYSCAKCRDIFVTFEKFILEETTAEEIRILDRLDGKYEYFR